MMAKLTHIDNNDQATDQVIGNQRREFQVSLGLSLLHQEYIRPLMDVQKGHALLEVGAWKGEVGVETYNHLQTYRHDNYRGTDVSPKFLEQVRKTASRFGYQPNQFYQCCPFDLTRSENEDDFATQPESIDSIFAVNTVHESGALLKIMDAMNVVVKPKGKILVVERACDFYETPEHIALLRTEPSMVSDWGRANKFEPSTTKIKLSYWGDARIPPLVNFYLILLKREK
jgi:SAM-dependent methyltransferase